MGILDYQTNFPPLTAAFSEEKIRKKPIHEQLVSRNWTLMTPKDLRRLPPLQRNKWLAYENPSKEVRAAQRQTQRRIQVKKQELTERERAGAIDAEQREKHNQLIGQLKAAEARNRLRIMRTTFLRRRAEDINHLIAAQPNALQAVRLQAMVPPKFDKLDGGDSLEPLDRKRVEELMEDLEGRLTNRKLS